MPGTIFRGDLFLIRLCAGAEVWVDSGLGRLWKTPSHCATMAARSPVWSGFTGSKQFGFGDYKQSTAKKWTRPYRFLAEIEAVVLWKLLFDLIEPHYPKTSSKGGRPPYPLETMLRIHLLQRWYELSDPAMEDARIEVATMHCSAGIALNTDGIPDETTILAFRSCWR